MLRHSTPACDVSVRLHRKRRGSFPLQSFAMVRSLRSISGFICLHPLKKRSSALTLFHVSGAPTWWVGILLVPLPETRRGERRSKKSVARLGFWTGSCAQSVGLGRWDVSPSLTT
ncbi:hypothetical protein P7K49_039813 [Saguinus oedipus]|uniref:Uncharacterized protein n=1 Tax=Saguinus oedipus TaxID=9490 RepID=A0ABQ9TCB9_SAGOE|nr:hypothetical protein P7K49_039813 [Saguinus oedipus]